MQIKSIAKCSKGSILQYLLPPLTYQSSLNTFVLSIFEWPFYTGFTVFRLSNLKGFVSTHPASCLGTVFLGFFFLVTRPFRFASVSVGDTFTQRYLFYKTNIYKFDRTSFFNTPIYLCRVHNTYVLVIWIHHSDYCLSRGQNHAPFNHSGSFC